jgi:hypothetical protein
LTDTVVVQARRELERPQDGAPAADFQAQQMGMGETLKTGAQIGLYSTVALM